MGPYVHRKNILIYVQQDATLHSLFFLETALHVSGGNNRMKLMWILKKIKEECLTLILLMWSIG
jgi:hypothetical protein